MGGHMKFSAEEKILLGFAAGFAAVSLGVYFSLNYAGMGLTKIENGKDEAKAEAVYNAETPKNESESLPSPNTSANEIKEEESKTVSPPKQDTKEPAQNFPVNINTADFSELTNIVGVGEVIAQRILDYRTQSGPFKTVEEIMNVKGIGEVTFEKMKSSITV